MANVVFLDAGTDATFDTSFYTVAGTVASATDQVFTGPHSLKLSTGSPAVTATATVSAILADAGRRISVYFRYDTTPAANSGVITIGTSATAAIFTLQVQTSNVLRLLPNGPASPVDGTTVLSTGTWYRITFAYTITNSTTYSVKVYLNGVLEITTSNVGTLTNITSANFRLLWPLGAGATTNAWFDNLYIDDGTDLADPGNMLVTAKRPNANGATDTFDSTTTTTNSGYGTGNSIYVNQRPLLTTGARFRSATGVCTENYAVENAATGDVDLTGKTIVGWLAWMQASGVSTDKIWDNGSVFLPTNANVSGTAGIRWHATTSATYPSSTACAGMDRPTSSATDAVLNECGLIVAYLGSTAYTQSLSASTTAMSASIMRGRLIVSATVAMAGAIVKLIQKVFTAS